MFYGTRDDWYLPGCPLSINIEEANPATLRDNAIDELNQHDGMEAAGWEVDTWGRPAAERARARRPAS
jgi:hypothetical protein